MSNDNCTLCGGTDKVPIVDTIFDTTHDAPCPQCCPPETFVCAECGHTLPVSHRHDEKPSVCFLDYVSAKDAKEIERVVAEVNSGY